MPNLSKGTPNGAKFFIFKDKEDHSRIFLRKFIDDKTYTYPLMSCPEEDLARISEFQDFVILETGDKGNNIHYIATLVDRRPVVSALDFVRLK